MNKSELHTRIEEALRAGRPMRQAPPGFAERVIDALPARGMPQRQAPPLPTSQSLWPRLALAGVLGLAAFVMWKGFAPRPGTEPVMAVNTDESSAADRALAKVSLEQVQALTAKIDQPLEKELERVKADTRNAIRFVASNFMPDQN